MLKALTPVGAALFALSLPYWLPRAVVLLRNLFFTRINGQEGTPIPGKLVDAAHFRQVYAHPAANGRSHGATLSDVFWYWLAPGPHIHQEHIEPGERYEEVARATRRMLAVSKKTAEDLAAQCVVRVIDELDICAATTVRLRDLMMPVWAEFYYKLVFGERCPLTARQLIVDNANDVATALKCCGLRHMEKRHRLTRFLIGKIEAGAVPHTLPEHLSAEDQAFYLQGVFFNTAIVQTSEAMAHLFMALAQHQDVQERLVANLDGEAYLDRVIAETFRLYPLFGISHRITSGDIAVDEKTTIPAGSVLCFNHAEFHHSGFEDPDRFDVSRWETQMPHEANYIPFGVGANRPCPAQGLAPITMRAAAREMLRRFAFYTSASHTRSIPNRGPCLVVPRTASDNASKRDAALLVMQVRDRWEDVGRSLTQLVLGTYMVWDARRLRLCERYFDNGSRHDEAESSCPVGHAVAQSSGGAAP